MNYCATVLFICLHNLFMYIAAVIVRLWYFQLLTKVVFMMSEVCDFCAISSIGNAPHLSAIGCQNFLKLTIG